ncbi:MAG: SipW-dependent-type signal peptide-containing protein [Candidatus Limivicinus sp.]|nr:SipW-dependent-type signal peptide-containing protein [Candidatus Limivicinus sp.]
MKKKITAIFLCVALVAIAVVGASLAYFTDTDNETNTFTVGNVKIDLIEKQKGENGLEAFDQDKTLVPGKSNDGNAVSKIATVKNTGKNDAWVWAELRIPKYLVSSEYPSNESKNALHWNSYGCFNVEYNSGNYWRLAITDGIVDADHKVTDPKMVAVEDGLWYDYQYVGTETIGDIEYVVIRTKMQNTLPAGMTSLPFLAQVYMDWRVTTNEDGTQFILPAGDPISTDASWEIIVNAYAIQTEGFKTVDDAIAAYATNGK